MPKNYVLHIGTPKTGTTSIQRFLVANRQRLLEQGVLYPKSLGRLNHNLLAAYSQSDRKMSRQRRDLGLNLETDLEGFRTELRRDFLREIQTTNVDFQSVIISNEAFSNTLRSEDEVQTLQKFLSQNYDSIRILIYLRRQDQRAVSDFAQNMKGGGNRESILPDISDVNSLLKGNLNYELIIGRWATVFGADAITVRVFSPESFIDGDLVTDFCAQVPVPDLGSLVHVGRKNITLKPLALIYLGELNKHIPKYIDGKQNVVRNRMMRFINEHFVGQGLRPARRDAEAFFSLFRESNERIRQKYVSSTSFPLFNEEFSMYPSVCDDLTPTYGDGVAMTEEILRHVYDQSSELISRDEKGLNFDVDSRLRTARDSLLSQQKGNSTFADAVVDSAVLLEEAYIENDKLRD